MPSGTKVQQFIDDLKEGKSKVCRAFDDLFGDPLSIEKWKTGTNPLHNNRGELKKKGFWPKPAPGLGHWLHDELTRQGGSGTVKAGHELNSEDLNHITDWPDEQKDVIRMKVDGAIDSNRLVQFWWRLWDGVNSEIEVKDSEDESAIQITFLTPRTKVAYPKQPTGDVDIGI